MLDTRDPRMGRMPMVYVYQYKESLCNESKLDGFSEVMMPLTTTEMHHV